MFGTVIIFVLISIALSTADGVECKDSRTEKECANIRRFAVRYGYLQKPLGECGDSHDNSEAWRRIRNCWRKCNETETKCDPIRSIRPSYPCQKAERARINACRSDCTKADPVYQLEISCMSYCKRCNKCRASYSCWFKIPNAGKCWTHNWIQWHCPKRCGLCEST